MATISIFVPDDQEDRVVNAMASRFNWSARLGAKPDFAKAKIAEWIREVVHQEEVKAAQLAAGDAVGKISPS